MTSSSVLECQCIAVARVKHFLVARSNALVAGLQELIIQNFRAKRGTAMAGAPEPPLEELLWSVAIARLLFGPAMNIQAPPNLAAGATLPTLQLQLV